MGWPQIWQNPPASLDKYLSGSIPLEIQKSNADFSEENFEGFLAYNTNKSIYLPGQQVDFSLTVLDKKGEMICEKGDLRISIYNPRGEESALSTKDNSIKVTSDCKVKFKTNLPDYQASWQIPEIPQGSALNYWLFKLKQFLGLEDILGKYKVVVSFDFQGKKKTLEDSFKVKESVPFDVERIGPTRIYPPAEYQMTLRVKVNQDFSGEVIEYVPESFKILNPPPYTLNPGQIIWQVDWKAGEVHELKYQFDAPDVSPYLYLLGPLKFTETGSLSAVFQEARQWQIAADAEVVIDSSILDATDEYGPSPAVVFINDTTGYIFFIDATAQDLAYRKTTDGGATWPTLVVIDTAKTWSLVTVWYDQWTPGDTTGTKIHIAAVEDGTDDGWYTYLDTNGDTLRSAVIAYAPAATFTDAADGPTSIVKGGSGYLFAHLQSSGTPIGGQVAKSIDGGDTWTLITPTGYSATAADQIQLLPLKTGNDIIAIRADITNNDIDYQIYNETTDVWGGTWLSIATLTDSATYDQWFSASIKKSTGDVYLAFNNATAVAGNDMEFRVFSDSTRAWTAKTNLFTDDATLLSPVPLVDENTGDIYVSYLRGTLGTTMYAYYKKSSDGGTSWSAESAALGATGDDHKYMRGNFLSTERLYTAWYNDDTNDIFGSTVAYVAPGISGSLGKTSDGWSGAVPVYGTLTGGLSQANYPYARAQVVTPAAVTWYTTMTWSAANSRFEGVIYPGSNYCNGCADPNTGAFTVTVQLDNNSDFSSIDYSGSAGTFTTYITRRWNAINITAMGNSTEFNPTWNVDHWDYSIEDLNIGYTAAAQTNVVTAIPFHPTTASITNMAVQFNDVTVPQGTAASTTDCWWWDSGTHTLYVLDAALALTTWVKVDLDFDSDTDLFATRIDRVATLNMGERLFYNGLLWGNNYIGTAMFGGGHEGAGEQMELQARDFATNNDVSVDCMERVAVHVDNVILADASAYYSADIKWQQQEWQGYIVSENNSQIVTRVTSDGAALGWAQQLSNGIAAYREQTFYANKRYIKNYYKFTNNGAATRIYPLVWGREQWIGLDQELLDEGRYDGDTVDRTTETHVDMSTLTDPWMTAYDTGVFAAMGIIFQDADRARYGYFLTLPALTNATPWGEWVNQGTEYRPDDNDAGTIAPDTFFDKNYPSVAPSASVNFTFWQWGYDTTSWANIETAIEADSDELNPAATVSCSTNISSTSFGSWTDTSIKTSSSNASTTMSCSGTSLGCALYVKDQGNGANPGLWNSISSKLIASADATLQDGVEGYGIQATSTSPGLTIAAKYNQTGNSVGGLLFTNTLVASSTADISNAIIIVTHKAAISGTTLSGNYGDTITYECIVN